MLVVEYWHCACVIGNFLMVSIISLNVTLDTALFNVNQTSLCVVRTIGLPYDK